MTYTAVKITEKGPMCLDGHLWRISREGPNAKKLFMTFVDHAAPGVYSVWLDADEIKTEIRGESMLTDGMPVHYRISPFCDHGGSFQKPATASAYDDVRLNGIATMLTSKHGMEIYESCRASVIGWDGERLVLSPSDRPRVASVAEWTIKNKMEYVEQPIFLNSDRPLILVNAVKGICQPDFKNRKPFPVDIIKKITESF